MGKREERALRILAAVLLAIFAGLATEQTFAQGTGKISGTVTESDTGEPLPGVNVVVEGTTLGTTSDASGDYFIANLEPDTYSIRASFVGFTPVTVNDVRVRSNTTTDIDIEMQPETLELGEEVVVTAERPLVERDNTTSLVVMNASEIEARPTRDLNDVLASLPSINVESGEMVFRGGTIDQVSFLLDGQRVRNPVNHNPYTRINLSSIQEMEVITGAFNAEYGEARSGVINVITKDGTGGYQLFMDSRYSPPGVRHWGEGFYDRSTDLYWENTHARHLEWWVEYPDMWVDPNGTPGSSPNSTWTPEEAHENYLETHQPLTNYDDIPTYETEIGVGGPIPLTDDFFFYASGKYRSEPPVMGNAFRDRAQWYDGSFKLTWQIGDGRKLTGSGFYGQEDAGWGFSPDVFWADAYGPGARYAYFDQAGYEEQSTQGQTLRYTHVLNTASMYEVKVSRLNALRRLWTFPGDSLGFDASEARRDNLRAVDESGSPIPGGFSNRIGYHTSGYLYRFDNDNTEWSLEANYSNQLTKQWHLKAGLQGTYYQLDHYNEAKFPANSLDDNLYQPYQGAAYAQNKIEVGGLIMNAGLRLDFYNPNDEVYSDLFNPLTGETEATELYAQVSPRLGVSHPIDENTVLHFSYGHFFQRPSFFDNGEGLGGFVSGSLTTLIITDTVATSDDIPVMIGNRNLRPTKTINYEVGIERSFMDFFVLDLTGFYKDSRNTIRTVEVSTPQGTYRTNGNGDYGDVRGFEVSIRKVPSRYRWGAFWGYANYTTQLRIEGRSGDPVAFAPNQVRFAPSGDNIQYQNPILKAGLFYETPTEWSGLLGSVLKNLSVSFDYYANFPNEQILSDIFVFEGEIYTRPVDQNVDFRARRDIRVQGVRISPYLEVSNLFNHQWIALGTFEQASQDDIREFVESGFDFLPDQTSNGTPILPIAKFRNLPRSVTFGITLEM